LHQHSPAIPGRAPSVALAAAALLIAAPAQALTINPTFDSSITSRANAATIEAAFDTAAGQLDKAFANPASVNITVSWGSIDGQKLGAGDVSGSIDNLSGPYTYAALVGDLGADSKANPKDASLVGAVDNLAKSDPTKINAFEIPYAEAKALGLLPPTLPITDGYVGFSGSAAFDFNPIGGVTTGDYDFVGLATHEMEEVLGRTTGLDSSAPTFATPFDLYRYSAAGVSDFSYTTAGYFSTNGGKTNLGDFNNAGTGDRSDWEAVAGTTDLQDAFFTTGKAYALSHSDLTALNVLGWGAWVSPGGALSSGPSTLSPVGAAQAVPEPASWTLLIVGFGAVGFTVRRYRMRPLNA
jgi:hypothetical protein